MAANQSRRRLAAIRPVSEARGVSRFPRKPLNIGLKRLREHDRQLREQREQALAKARELAA